MFIIANFLTAVAYVLDLVLWTYMFIVIARALISWVSPDPYNPIVRFLYNATEPLLYQVRRRIPLQMGGIDLSPMLVLLVLVFLRMFLVASLNELAYGLR